MTVSTTIIKRTYHGNGVTRLWDVDFPLFAQSDLKVWLTSPQGTQEQIYDFALNATETLVEYPTQSSEKLPLPTGWQITLLRETPITQTMNLIRHGELDAELLEAGYDKLTLISQEIHTQQLQHSQDLATQAQALEDETQERQEDISLLQQQLDAQTAAYTQADTSLQNQLVDESNARNQKDMQLLKNLQTEVSARLAAEQVFQHALDSKQPLGDYITTSQLNAGLATKQNLLTDSQMLAVNSGVTSTIISQLLAQTAKLTAFAPYIQSAAVRDMNEQETVNAADLLAATGDLHALNLDLSQNTVLKKLTAAGTSGSLANLSGVLVSNSAPLDGATSPQIDLSYSTLNKTALVNLFNSMPYNVGYTAVGSPTITDGVASNFSTSNYLVSSQSINSNSFEKLHFCTRVKTPVSFVYGWTLVSTIGEFMANRNSIGIWKPQESNAYFNIFGIDMWESPIIEDTWYRIEGIISSDGHFIVRQFNDNGQLLFERDIEGLSYSFNDIVTFGQQYGGAVDAMDFNNTFITLDEMPWFRGTATTTKTCNVSGCSGTADLTSEDKAIATDKGWSLTVA